MPDAHTFRPTVQPTGLLERAKQWREQTGTDWPHGLGEAFAWSVRDVTAGTDVASGFAASFEEADRQAQSALEVAEDVEGQRYAQELGL